MATPRVFVSSTCMDFQEIRRQLRRFIQDHGFEPVMSEFNDIFYDFDSHVQDACKNEIERCNLFILIVGNRYGSVYHKEVIGKTYPDSITLQEFKKALQIQIPKHILIEKFVKYDYDNYVRALEQKYTDYFEKNDVNKDKIENIKRKIRTEFDATYHFSQPQYKYIFSFLDLIHSLDSNNAILPFETFENIKESLLSQWAGLMYEALEKNTSIPASNLISLEKKVDKLDIYLQDLLATKQSQTNKGKLIFDISKLTTDIDFENLEKLKEKIDSVINELLVDEINDQRGIFKTTPTDEWAKRWVTSLPAILKKYKWSKTIVFKDVFLGRGMNVEWYPKRMHIPYRTVFEFNQIYKSFTPENQGLLLNTLIEKITPFVNISTDNPFGPSGDDIPF